MRNSGKKIIHLIIGTVIALWLVYTVQHYEETNIADLPLADEVVTVQSNNVPDYEREAFGTVCQMLQERETKGFTGEDSYDTWRNYYLTGELW